MTSIWVESLGRNFEVGLALLEGAIRDHLARHGIAAEPTKLRFGAEGSGPSIYVVDPDGNTIELRGPPAA